MRYPIFRSIRFNLILLVLISVLPALGAIIYTGLDNNRRTIKEAENNTLRVLADLAYDYELTVQQAHLFLSMLARLPDIQNQNAAACNKILGELIKQNPLYVKLFVATADGTVYASNEPFSPHTIKHRKYYQDIIKMRAFSVGEYEAGVTGQRPVIHFAYPVIDTKQRLRGVVALALDLNRYGEIFIKKELPEDSAFAIYDHNHIYLYRYPDPGKYIGKKDRPDMIKRMLTGPDEEAITAIGAEGIPRLGAYKKLYLQGSSDPYHFMRVGISADKALANAKKTFLMNIVILCSALFAALILALVFGDIFVARRLNRLVIASNRLGGGDLTARIGLRHDEGEMGRLAHAFDEMADALERKEAQRKRAEEELRIFMESVENSSDAVGMSTPEGKHYYQNRAFDELFGPVGENPPESVYVDPAVGHEVFRAIMEGGQWTGEVQMYAKDRRILDILLRAYANKDKSGSITALVGIHMDITKRKRAEESLKQSEERMRLFFERQLVGMAITSLEKGWLQVNKRLSEMLGYLPEELSLRTWAELTYPDDLAADVAQFNRLLSGEIDHYALEKRFIRKDGAVISTNLSVGCVRRHNGSVDYVLALLEDITEQKRIEADLRDIEARYSLIMNNITDRIWLTDMNFRILWASESVANDRGYQLEEMNPFPFEKLLTPDSLETAIRAISEELTPQRLQQTELDISKTLELEFFRKDGSTFWSEVTTKVLRDHDGTPNSILGVGRDITERKRAEEALRESEKRYRSIFETTLEGIYQTSPQGHYLRINPAFALMLGYDSPAELIESITDIGIQVYVNPERRSEFKRHLSEHDRVENFEAQLYRKDGTTMWGLINGVTVRNENGEILYYTGGMMDITARKEAETRLRHTYEQLRAADEQMRAQYVSLMESERSLRESEEKYRRLTETAHDVIVSVDLNWKITYVNQATLNMAGGMNPVGMSLLNFTPPHMHELQEAMMQKRREGFRDVLSFEWEINPPTGKKAIFEIRSTLLTEDEKPSGVLFVARDITERKEAETRLRYAEEKYRLIAENMVDVIAVLDMKLGYTYISPSIMRLRGLTVEEAMKETLDQVMTPASLKLAFAAFEEEMKMEASGTADPDRTRIFELEEFRKDGSKIWVETNSSFLRDKDGKPVGMITITRDITERKRTEEEKRHLEERLQRAEKMEALGQLAGGVAHDLNNVLGVLSGYSELLLLEIPKGHRSRGHAEKILQSTEKGAAIIDDLLTLARRSVVVSDVINLNSLVSGFIKTPVFESMKDYHPRVTFRTEYDKNLLNIKGSPVHLEKTLMNLISNAAESISGNGMVTIRTESRYLDKPLRGYDEVKEGDYAILTVSDTGMGIPVENREKIFEPFYTKKTMGRSGTGLGLAIVWGTVKDHNGYIDVRTEVGEGTTFTLYFPVTREEMTAPLQKETMERYMGKGESVLVVDDISEQRDVAAGLLTRLGYNVRVVSSGEEAVEYLKSNKADILVLDMIMAPGIDGLETYERVLAINPKQKAILVSGFSETQRAKKAQKLGAGAYVKKPYIMEKIGGAIRDELNRK